MQINLDEGYQFGLGLFETIAVEQKKPVLLRAHLKRLERSMKFLGISTGSFEEASISDYLRQHPMEHGALKIMVSGENRIFTSRPNPYTRKRYEKGFVMDYSQVVRNETSPLVYHKTLNYGDCILEKRKAAAAGMDERIFLNTKGEICEGTCSNIFFVKEGRIYTPELSCGMLPGILREYLCKTEAVEEIRIFPWEIQDFQECFVTNSLMGIMPVERLGDQTFSRRETAEKLMEIYRKRNVQGNLS